MGSEYNSSSDLFSHAEIEDMFAEGRNEWRLQRDINVRAINDRMTPFDEESIEIDGSNYVVDNKSNRLLCDETMEEFTSNLHNTESVPVPQDTGS